MVAAIPGHVLVIGDEMKKKLKRCMHAPAHTRARRLSGQSIDRQGHNLFDYSRSLNFIPLAHHHTHTVASTTRETRTDILLMMMKGLNRQNSLNAAKKYLKSRLQKITNERGEKKKKTETRAENIKFQFPMSMRSYPFAPYTACVRQSAAAANYFMPLL